MSGAISANLAGTGGFIKTGAGSVTLSGVNTFSGDTAVQAGSLIVTSAAGLADGSNLTVGSLTNVFNTVQPAMAAARAAVAAAPAAKKTLAPAIAATVQADGTPPGHGHPVPAPLSARRIAVDPVWLARSNIGPSINSGQTKDRSIQALDAVLAEYGRS